MPNPSDEELRQSLLKTRARLDEREARIEEREASLLDRVTLQVISIVLLRALRKNGKLKPADLNEIRFARENWDSDDYNPRNQLQRILAEGFLDREEKRPTPGKS